MSNSTGMMFTFVTEQEDGDGFWWEYLGSSVRDFLTNEHIDDIEEKIHEYIENKKYNEAVFNLVNDVINYLHPQIKKNVYSNYGDSFIFISIFVPIVCSSTAIFLFICFICCLYYSKNVYLFLFFFLYYFFYEILFFRVENCYV
jgi:hypothetical protein